MTKINLNSVTNVHFIGIGGVGISAIARMMITQGVKVSGSDSSSSFITDELKKLGAEIFNGHEAVNVPPETNLVIYTIAVNPDNPELKTAEEKGIPILSYPEILGQISRQKKTVAVAGTHGKTTTTGMLASIAVQSGLDPTVIIGSFIKDQTNSWTNFIAGKSNLLIVEACEYRRSFLNLDPAIVVITNIDNDHLDYYKDLNDIKSAFQALVSKIPTDGVLVCNPNDPLLAEVITAAKCPIIDYTKVELDFNLTVPGVHNRLNAQAALAVAEVLKADRSKALQGLLNFRGTWRRFEMVGLTQKGAFVYSDYGHHPTEIKATINSALELRDQQNKAGKIFVIFQPHLYSRTKMLLNEFSQSFSHADEVIITDIYPAREPFDDSIHARDLVKLLGREKDVVSSYESDLGLLSQKIKDKAQEGDIVLVIGAGDIDKFSRELVG